MKNIVKILLVLIVSTNIYAYAESEFKGNLDDILEKVNIIKKLGKSPTYYEQLDRVAKELYLFDKKEADQMRKLEILVRSYERKAIMKKIRAGRKAYLATLLRMKASDLKKEKAKLLKYSYKVSVKWKHFTIRPSLRAMSQCVTQLKLMKRLHNTTKKLVSINKSLTSDLEDLIIANTYKIHAARNKKMEARENFVVFLRRNKVAKLHLNYFSELSKFNIVINGPYTAESICKKILTRKYYKKVITLIEI